MTLFWFKYVTKRKSRRCLYYLIISLGVTCVMCYQIYFLNIVSNEEAMRMKTTDSTVQKRLYIRGVKHGQEEKFRPNKLGKFECFHSKELIDYSRLNDNYCDCESDGSDEPGTSACQNGVFSCETPNERGFLPSGRVNDGICDCCDGSDEWLQLFPHNRLSERLQKQLGRYQSPCPNLCPDDI